MEHQTTFTKIIKDGDVVSLYTRAFDDIRAESWGVQSIRPLVYMSDTHEAIEKSLWCYLNNMVPLIGEKDPNLTARLAILYAVDSVITDIPSLKRLFSFFSPYPGQLVAISVVEFSPDAAACAPYREHAGKFRLVQTNAQGNVLEIHEC